MYSNHSALVRCLTPIFLVVSVAGAEPAPEPATLAPLADTALLLDATAVDGAVIAVGAYGHILRITDDLHWTQLPSPVRRQLTAVHFVSTERGWAVGHDAAIVHTDDGGLNWTVQYFDPSRDPFFDVLFVDGDTGFVSGAYGQLLRTDDAGTTWDDVEYTEYPDYHLNAIVQPATGVLVVLGERGVAFRSTDGGDTWEELEFPYDGSMFGAVTTGTGRIVTFGLRGHVYTSDDAGTTWAAVETGTELSLMGGNVLADGRVVLAGNNGTILVSNDGGDSFTRYRHPDGDALAGVLAAPGNGLVVLGENGMAPLTLEVLEVMD